MFAFKYILLFVRTLNTFDVHNVLTNAVQLKIQIRNDFLKCLCSDFSVLLSVGCCMLCALSIVPFRYMSFSFIQRRGIITLSYVELVVYIKKNKNSRCLMCGLFSGCSAYSICCCLYVVLGVHQSTRTVYCVSYINWYAACTLSFFFFLWITTAVAVVVRLPRTITLNVS